MSEEHVEMQDPPAEATDASGDYVAPTLTDLGSFQELTQTGLSGNVDVEGLS
ncbi:MAG: hypothetical protein QOF55_2315 [Thermoleophilaceae bacterium]|jgi:hypothetical protein|nr:hypothetical protein [Thermoleophilaceae bacterium]